MPSVCKGSSPVGPAPTRVRVPASRRATPQGDKSFGRFDGTKLDERLSVPDSEPRYAEEVAAKPKEVQALFAWGALWYLSSCRISLGFCSANY